MNKLQKLIHELCPDGVQYRKIGDIADFIDGYPFQVNDFVKYGKYPVVRISNIQNGRIVIDNNTTIEEIPSNYKKTAILMGHEILIALSGATAGKSGLNEHQQILVNQRIVIIIAKKEVLQDYLKHYFVKSTIEKMLMEKGTGPNNNISKNDIAMIKILLPPLPVQEEIVRILDKFTQLEAELEAELEARKKQYEYYRNRLLSFEPDSVEAISDCHNISQSEIGTTDFKKLH